LSIREALVDLEERHDILFIPEIARRRLPLDFPVHGVFEQDGAQDPVAAESRAGDDSCAHLVHNREHFVIVGPGVRGYAVQSEGLRRAAAALVERCDESGLGPYLLDLLFEAHLIIPYVE
jgi:hypothetical protein